MELWLVVAAAFLAGVMDAMVGGGGLVTVPALLSTYTSLPPALLLGTNKCSSVFGTTVAAWRYSHRVQLDWTWLAPAALVAFVGAGLGAWTLTWMDPQFLRKLLPWVLLLVLVYTLKSPQFGLHHAPIRQSARARLWLALAIGAGIGWYDGFFGPGTGSFFIFLLVRWLGQDFLHASASAKVLNATTNLAALLMLAATGHVWWQVGLVMAAANVAGSLVGTALALKHGAGLVRRVFMLVVVLLILKTGVDAYVV
ncbi:TSUP family transporter [Methylophilus sp. OH31]|uniref:sulfite exporter TauE/SafE family protein n=1 Tax=Methylophilus sp. OH31 TaxID=1387312 RepID=UPI000467D8D7|nr:TSUP family transporter [Methylophilus sp. OH31]